MNIFSDITAELLYVNLRSAGLPVVGVADNGVNVNPRFRVDLDSTGTPAQQAQADQIAANLDTSQAAQDTFRTQVNRTDAKAALTGTDANAKLLRAALQVVFASLVETRSAVNQLIAYANVHGGTLTPLANRTWQQVVQATAQQIDSGQAD